MDSEARELALKLAVDIHKQEMAVRGVSFEQGKVISTATEFYDFLNGTS